MPDYLKNLESILASTGTEGSSPTPTPSKTLTLESVGFGSMVSTAGRERGFKLLIVSTHIQQNTGYAKVTHGIMQELVKQPWIHITHFAIQKFADTATSARVYPSGVDVVDVATMENPPQAGFGTMLLPDVIRKVKPTVVLIYNDMATVGQYIEAIRKTGIPRTFKLWVYCDQVYTTQSQIFIDIFNRDADRIFAFTPYWKKCLKDQGVTRPVDVLLHGFNQKAVFPMPRDLARKQLSLPTDMFLFLNLNRNQPRKRYDILIMAFVELLVKYPTKPLYLLCVCDKGEKGGWFIFELFSRELTLRGVPIEPYSQRLIVTAQNMSFKDEEINMFYNAADVGISTADGEGWGLCQFEQMGVGVPQVVPDIGGFKEYCNAANSVMVKPTVRYYIPGAYSTSGGEATACDPHSVCLAMEEYVLNSEKRHAHGRAARETVLQYTWEKACEPLVRQLRRVKDDDE